MLLNEKRCMFVIAIHFYSLAMNNALSDDVDAISQPHFMSHLMNMSVMMIDEK